MEKSIFRTVFLYAFVQIFFIVASSITTEVPIVSILAYAGISTFFHLCLCLFLLRFKSHFYNQTTNTPLTSVNLANRITLLRISSLPTIAFLLRHKDISQIKIILPILLALVFLTDSFDGQIARRKKQITKMGAMLDSISDYALIGLISIIYFRNDIVPHWFIILIVIRLFLQALGMLVFIMMKKPVEMKSTWGGKITIAITMTLYLAELVRLYLPTPCAPFFRIAEYISGAVILALSFEKGSIFFRQGKKISADQKRPG